jgi:hypothetical protein
MLFPAQFGQLVSDLQSLFFEIVYIVVFEHTGPFHDIDFFVQHFVDML